MIDLTPIDERIQKRLFQKMELLGRANVSPNNPTDRDGLTQQNLSNRTTFIRMTSGLERPVILMGGELEDDGSMVSGYEDIYGPRRLDVYEDGELIGAGDTENKFKRPLPGIKSIDVEFKGGVRALREATISWTCWSFEDIDRLTPHFLAHGKTIMLEWGWVYDKNSLRKLPTLINENGIKRSAYNDYKKEVLKADGDFDFTVGIIKNFEYTTREDGAFDCQTIITSVGASIVNNFTPNQNAENTSTISQLTKEAELEELKKLVNSKDEEIINFDVGVSLKTFISYFDNYIRGLARKGRDSKEITPVLVQEGNEERYITYDPNKFITEGPTPDGIQSNVWVRWGWFEDNILSKFLTLVSENNQRPFLTQFRSVEKTDDGEFESTRVRTHKRLETIDINKFILPGKFKTFELEDKKTLGVTTKDRGDRELHLKLSEIVNKNFSLFDHSSGKYGRMRNFLINTKILRKAFGVNRTEITTESINLRESLLSILDYLNQDIPFWSFEITQDNEHEFRTKIIDNSQTAVDFKKEEKINKNVDGNIGTKSIYQNGEVINNGVFFFPVWQHNSIVKSQNITTKIPDGLALSVMYGSNIDNVKFLDNSPPEVSSIEASALAGLYKNPVDKNLKNLDIALRKENYRKIGSESDSDDITLNGGTDNVFTFLKLVSNNIKKKYEEKVENINKQLKSSREEKEARETDEKIRKLELELNQPFPTPDMLRDSNPEKFNQLIKDGYFKSVYDRKYHETGKMRQSFADFISDSVSVTPDKNLTENSKPLLIPMDMELEIDGIGGILPGNSYHSTYLPSRYQEDTMFQIFDVGHKVDSSTWSVSLSGVMRSSFSKMTSDNKTIEIAKITDKLFELKDRFEQRKKEELAEKQAKQFEILENSTWYGF